MELQPFVSAIFHVSILSLLLVIGKILRVKIKALQYILLPSAAVAGLVAIAVSPYSWGNVINYPEFIVNIFDNFGEISIFLLNFVFAGMFLGRKIPSFKKSFKEAGPQILLGQILSWGQIMVPMFLTVFILNRFYDIPDAFGTLVAIGFDGGASVAVGYTSTFQELGWYPEGIQLAIASGVVGIIGGCTLGVLLINWLVRRGHTEIAKDPKDLPDNIRKGLYTEEGFERAGTITIVPQSLEPLALHFALFGVSMLGGWLIVEGLASLNVIGEFLLSSAIGGFAAIEITATVLEGLSTFFGFAPLFPFAMITGLFIQLFLKKINLDILIDRGLVERLQGLALEFCILAVFASLNIPLILESSIPLSVILLGGIVWTAGASLWIAPNIMPDYWAERMLVDYGQSMGNVPVGMMLLRVVDPEFETPVLEYFSYKHAFHAPIFFSILAFLPIVAYMWGAEAVLIISGSIVVLCLILAKILYKKQTRTPVLDEFNSSK